MGYAGHRSQAKRSRRQLLPAAEGWNSALVSGRAPGQPAISNNRDTNSAHASGVCRRRANSCRRWRACVMRATHSAGRFACGRWRRNSASVHRGPLQAAAAQGAHESGERARFAGRSGDLTRREKPIKFVFCDCVAEPAEQQLRAARQRDLAESERRAKTPEALRRPERILAGAQNSGETRARFRRGVCAHPA